VSRIQPPDDAGEELLPLKRKNFTKKQRREVSEKQEGKCWKCGEPIEDIDHIIPLELGGKHEPANWEGLCKRCHKTKTALDMKLIGKARRIRKRISGDRRPRKTIPSRQWPKKGD